MKEKVFSNMIWNFLERTGAQLVSFVVSIVLARILAPEAYGTVALVTVFTNILAVFVDAGFSNAVIQKKNADDLDFSTVFYFNIAVCVVLYIIMFILAPIIAGFYNNSALTALIRVSSLTLVVSGLKRMQTAYVSRNLMFKKFFFATLTGTIVAAIVGISMAYMGFGVWALIVQNLLNITIDTILLWITVEWRPQLVFSFERLKTLFSFSSKILAAGLLDTFCNELRTLAIGKLYSPGDLAFFNKGQSFPKLIMTNINNSMDHVLLPVLSGEQEDILRVKYMTRKAVRVGSYIIWPMMVGLAACAEPFIRLVLTEKWLPCVFYLRIFCVLYVFYPITSTNGEVIKAVGRSDIFLKMNVINNIIGVLSILCTMFISVKAVGYSFLLTCLIGQVTFAMPNKQLIDYSYVDQIKDILPTIVLSVFMGVVVYFVGKVSEYDVINLILQIGTGAAIYIVGSVMLKFEEFYYIADLLRGILNKKKES